MFRGDEYQMGGQKGEKTILLKVQRTSKILEEENWGRLQHDFPLPQFFIGPQVADIISLVLLIYYAYVHGHVFCTQTDTRHIFQ